jgi:uncharacterized membrane protein YeaQ/YmgE (transglycosylase-associated protein family)
VGSLIGAVTGWLTFRVTKQNSKGLIRDAFLGLFGYLAGIIGCALVPWPENTIMERLDGGVLMTSTMTRYQHPERVAVAIAILLPLLYEWIRSRKRSNAVREPSA